MIVLDSSFLVAYHNARDVHHDAAARIMERLLADEWGTPLLLEYVFLEVVTVLRLRLDLRAAVQAGDALLSARELTFVSCSDLFLDAFEHFRVQAGASLSFVDAAIASVARRQAPGRVATFDRDFDGLEGIEVVRLE